jgi:hypothetical protein
VLLIPQLVTYHGCSYDAVNAEMISRHQQSADRPVWWISLKEPRLLGILFFSANPDAWAPDE